MHLFKFCTQLADLFISDLDLSAKTIAYSVRDKETGKLLEPHSKSKLVVNGSQVVFDTNRTFDINLARHIEATLKS